MGWSHQAALQTFTANFASCMACNSLFFGSSVKSRIPPATGWNDAMRSSWLLRALCWGSHDKKIRQKDSFHTKVLRFFGLRWGFVPGKLTYHQKKSILKMIFLFPRWDKLVPWRVKMLIMLRFLWKKIFRSGWEQRLGSNYSSVHLRFANMTTQMCIYIYIHIYLI